MSTNIFAVLLIVGIAMFATGIGGRYAMPLMAVGGIGLVVSAFTGGKR